MHTAVYTYVLDTFLSGPITPKPAEGEIGSIRSVREFPVKID